MKKITFDDQHRRNHFAFFNAMAMPHFSLVVPVDVGLLVEYIRVHELHFTGTVVYLISRAANAVPELRRRIRRDEIVEHDVVHPSYTVATRESGVFGFCEVEYTQEYREFIRRSDHARQAATGTPSLEDEDRDDYLFLSSLPWVHFTSMPPAMHVPALDSVPRFVWGKIQGNSGTYQMPLSLQAHHAVVDGLHAGKFYEIFETYCKTPDEILGST